MQGGGDRDGREQRYSLATVRRRHLALHGWTERDVVECIAGLSPADFHKSQAHRIHADVWLDIYKPVFEGERRYVKFTQELGGDRLVLLSFCLDGEDH